MRNEGETIGREQSSEVPQSSEQETTEKKKSLKSRRPSFLMKKLKLRGRRSSVAEEVLTGAETSPEQQISPEETERKTPEGTDSFAAVKSSSEINLTEVSWKSADNLTEDSERSSVRSVITTEISRVSVLEGVGLPERTKSLENLKSMPAFGELIVDQAATMTSTNQTSKPRDHLYKILVIGDLGAGKTSIIKRYVHQFFSQHYRATIGVDFALKVINWDDNTLVRLQLWDIAGQERYGNMTRVYYKEATGAFIVFDVTRYQTFESVVKWKLDLDSKVRLPDGSPIPCVLLANKCDQKKEGLVTDPAQMDEYCRAKGFAAWFETSAKENINIEEATRALVQKILLNDSLINCETNRDGDQFSLTKETKAQSNGRKCSC